MAIDHNESFRLIDLQTGKTAAHYQNDFLNKYSKYTIGVESVYACPASRTKGGYSYNIENWAPLESRMLTMSIGHKLGAISDPAQQLFIQDGLGPWSDWSGADYINGWNVLGEKSFRESSEEYGKARLNFPTMYRHSEGAALLFFDGHAEVRAKEKVWNPEHFNSQPQQPRMWVANIEMWESLK